MRLSASDLKGIETAEPTTMLGDWYANILLIQRQQLVMLVSNRSRLCVLTTARDMVRIRPRFEHALMDLLRATDVPEEALLRESQAMERVCLRLTGAKATGRSILGSMNDYTRALQNSDLNERSLFDWKLYFSNWLCGPLRYEHPSEVALRLLKGSRTGPCWGH